MEAKLNIRKNAKCYYVRLTWYEANGKRRQTEVSTGILVEGDNKRKAKKKMEKFVPKDGKNAGNSKFLSK